MADIRFDRLLTLAEHLGRPQSELANEKFYFGRVVSLVNLSNPACGTMGCALGEMPGAFPESWQFDFRDGVWGLDVLCVDAPPFDDPCSRISYAHAERFFGLSRPQAEHLFTPGMQRSEFGGDLSLTGHASKEEVAAHIRAFCETMRDAPSMDGGA